MRVWIELRGRRICVDWNPGTSTLVDGIPYEVDWRETEQGVFSLLWSDPEGRVRSFRCSADKGAVLVNGERIDYVEHNPRSLRGLMPVAAGASGPTALKAPMPGRIVRLLVQAGELVEAGQGCLVMEAMKMQNELKAPRAGTVRKLDARAGETVAAGAVLLVVE